MFLEPAVILDPDQVLSHQTVRRDARAGARGRERSERSREGRQSRVCLSLTRSLRHVCVITCGADWVVFLCLSYASSFLFSLPCVSASYGKNRQLTSSVAGRHCPE